MTEQIAGYVIAKAAEYLKRTGRESMPRAMLHDGVAYVAAELDQRQILGWAIRDKGGPRFPEIMRALRLWLLSGAYSEQVLPRERWLGDKPVYTVTVMYDQSAIGQMERLVTDDMDEAPAVTLGASLFRQFVAWQADDDRISRATVR